MQRRNLEKIALEIHNVRQWLFRNTPRQRRARKALEQQSKLKWWLVHGPPRTGSSYLVRLIKTCARLYVNDWGLRPILAPIPGWLEAKTDPARDFITFDHERFLRDISNNILDNAYAGDGNQIDLVYKQVILHPNAYQALVEMWGPPERTIFCLREPAAYMASATKKFAQVVLETVQQCYLEGTSYYAPIGGDIFEYTPELSLEDYVSFLRPLNLERKRLPSFHYRGERDQEHTSEEMWNAYHKVKALAAEENSLEA
ncbi:MAG: hypothetical protein ACK2UI_12575 [Anaerolineae bacterium]